MLIKYSIMTTNSKIKRVCVSNFQWWVWSTVSGADAGFHTTLTNLDKLTGSSYKPKRTITEKQIKIQTQAYLNLPNVYRLGIRLGVKGKKRKCLQNSYTSFTAYQLAHMKVHVFWWHLILRILQIVGTLLTLLTRENKLGLFL